MLFLWSPIVCLNNRYPKIHAPAFAPLMAVLDQFCQGGWQLRQRDVEHPAAHGGRACLTLRCGIASGHMYRIELLNNVKHFVAG